MLQSNKRLWIDISQQISRAINQNFIPEDIIPVGGGCINQSFIVRNNKHAFFIKLNQESTLHMFEAEAAGLEEIHGSNSLRVPQPICTGHGHHYAWLILEYISLQNHGHAAELGSRLAQMHQYTADRFGWWRDNTIGSTPQCNSLKDDWLTFWLQHRLHYQLNLAQKNGYTGTLQTLGEHLLAELSFFFTDYQPQPSLLHGDLWSGNYAFDETGQPVIFDPAVYYGDRETDLAMTELFGGFSADFYASYRSTWPLDAGYPIRKNLYNLYHILNHLNLFGASYLKQAITMVRRLLAEAH